ncbi:hypothetical protein Fmac_030803 [Flemingia macrophylla]|uniref:Uncharacterized protein n=1 Tax=Flemingia macrophylla TaxID=520843 RepID=A0ABD1L0A8_9FABA
MGNANGREDGSIPAADPAVAEASVRLPHAPDSRPAVRAFSSDSMANSPPQSPRRSRSPILFGPQLERDFGFVRSARFFVDFALPCSVGEVHANLCPVRERHGARD